MWRLARANQAQFAPDFVERPSMGPDSIMERRRSLNLRSWNVRATAGHAAFSASTRICSVSCAFSAENSGDVLTV
jgi:hypothetical protein